MKNNIISIIHACDRNSYAWDKWYDRYSKFWPNEIPTVFISEEKKFERKGIVNLRLGIGWQQGIIKALDNYITEKYIIYQHEDFFLTAPVDYDLLMELLRVTCTYEADIMKCCGKHGGWDNAKFKKLEHGDMNGRVMIYKNSNEYLTSHQVSIWDKNFLRKTLDPKNNNWQHEIEGTRLARKLNPKILAYRSDKNPPDCQPIPYIEVIKHGRYKNNVKEYWRD